MSKVAIFAIFHFHMALAISSCILLFTVLAFLVRVGLPLATLTFFNALELLLLDEASSHACSKRSRGRFVLASHYEAVIAGLFILFFFL